MTGFGRGRRDGSGLSVVVEIKSVNGRFFKISVRAPPLLAARELDLEAVVRERVRRGTLTLGVHLKHTDPEHLAPIDEPVALAYKNTLARLGIADSSVPLLPGVIAQPDTAGLSAEGWALVREATVAALEDLDRMRGVEGAALAGIVGTHLEAIDRLRLEVRARAPEVVRHVQARLTDRQRELLAAVDVPLDPQLVAREVAILADRADVTEELDRLGAHLAQARAKLGQGGEVGRSLDFLAQELLREVNTIGAKSADAEISRCVVELKTRVDQIKEQVANLE